VITAKTFTAQYDGREDRIRWTINYNDPYQRIDYMISRAMLLRLFPVLEQILPEGARAIRPERNAPLRNGLAPTDSAALERTRDPEAPLLERVDFTHHPKAATYTVRFYAAPERHADTEATLNLDDLAKVTGILLGAVPFVAWGIAPNILEH